MAQRKSWSKQEDQILLQLKFERKIDKWASIAEIMRQQFGILERNPKQCRQRYHNHLADNISKAIWTAEEDQKLICFQNQHGNKWAHIARQLNGRTDNCVKNRFYTRFRRSLKILNDFISRFWKKQFKLLKICLIDKLAKFHDNCPFGKGQGSKNTHKKFDPTTLGNIKNLKYTIFLLQSREGQEKDSEKIHEILESINEFKNKNRIRGANRKKTKDSMPQIFGQSLREVDTKKIIFSQQLFGGSDIKVLIEQIIEEDSLFEDIQDYPSSAPTINREKAFRIEEIQFLQQKNQQKRDQLWDIDEVLHQNQYMQ